MLKARDPKKFVPVIEKSEIISEDESGLTRRVWFKGDGDDKKGGDGVQERVVVHCEIHTGHIREKAILFL